MNDLRASIDRADSRLVARTDPPAKLNLFLEVVARRADGFHEIDTVMVPVNWCDQLRLKRTAEPGIRLDVDWLPSRNEIAKELQIDPSTPLADELLSIPQDQTNLVFRALDQFSQQFALVGGFECQLAKSIPAGAGMGGASSDAASALLCAAALSGVDPRDPTLRQIAAQIGSDVPFFLGADQLDRPITAARATGRGEQIAPIAMSGTLDFLVVFPATSVSTSRVYANCLVPQEPQSGMPLAVALEMDDRALIRQHLLNRLSDPAKKIAPQITEILESMWRNGARTCQLTGSGSACFAIIDAPAEAASLAKQIRMEIGGTAKPATSGMQPGVRTKAVQSVSVPAEVGLTVSS